MIASISLILLSLLAIPSSTLLQSPDTQVLLDRLTRYRGYIGIGFFFWGTYSIVSYGITGLGQIPTHPLFWSTTLAVNSMVTTLGYLFGYGMIAQHVFSKSEEARKKGEQLLARLAAWQTKTGLAGLFLGGWGVIASFLFTS